MSKFTSFLLGGLIGAGIALAFAPRTGEQTRALVTEKANAFAGEAKDFADGFPGSAQDAVKTAREQGTSFMSDATSKVKAVAGKAGEGDADELREKIEAARQRIASQVMENAEKAKVAAEGVKDTAAEAVEVVSDAIDDATGEITERADEAKHAK